MLIQNKAKSNSDTSKPVEIPVFETIDVQNGSAQLALPEVAAENVFPVLSKVGLTVTL